MIRVQSIAPTGGPREAIIVPMVWIGLPRGLARRGARVRVLLAVPGLGGCRLLVRLRETGEATKQMWEGRGG